MRLKLFIFALIFMIYTPCYAEQIIVISVGGASDREIHDVVKEEASKFGYQLKSAEPRIIPGPIPILKKPPCADRHDCNYGTHNAAPIGVGWPHRIHLLRDKVMFLVKKHKENKSNLSVLLIGKSAGAMQIWGALDRYYSEFRGFYRIAIVLIDPHGAVIADDKWGRYDSDDPLSWPSHWSADTDFFRVYHIFQRLHPGGGGGLTGADFPDSRVFRSEELTRSGVNHTNIPEQKESRAMIQDAFIFASAQINLNWLVPVTWLY